MARRYGGKHSPGGAPAGSVPGGKRPPPDWTRKRRSRVGAHAQFLFVVPFIFAIKAFRGDPAELALNLGAFGLLMLAAWLTREGLVAQEAYDARKVARRPAIPRKIFGSVLTGLGLAAGGFAAGAGLFHSVLFALLGAGLHQAAFGPDPLRDKGLDGIDSFQTDRVARAVQEAEEHLRAMHAALRPVADRHLMAKLEAFQTHARDLFRAVEEDPRSLSAARRYLGVYLLGARDATEKFADLYARSRDPAVREDYAALLDDLDSNFSARRQALLASDRTALDIELEVLRDRLAREGLRPE